MLGDNCLDLSSPKIVAYVAVMNFQILAGCNLTSYLTTMASSRVYIGF